MDEGWGNLIYFLAAAVFAIFGAFNKKKKARNTSVPTDTQQEMNETQPIPTTDFDSILDSLLGEEKRTPYREENFYEEEVELENSKETFVQKETKKESVDDNKEAQKTFFDTLSESYDQEEEEEEKVEIDWRNAIIYKEILDRKYN